MKNAYVFPGQGSQFPGMGKDHYDNSAFAKKLFEQANELLGFRLSDVMFNGTEEDLRETNISQPAVFLHSIIAYKSIDPSTGSGLKPDMVAGHSLGEFSALVANGTLSFEDALQLVAVRARAMQRACKATPSTMAAVLGLDGPKVEAVCAQVQKDTGEIVVPANYNNPSQLVISGSLQGIAVATVSLKEAGAKRVVPLSVGGAFHSPLMASAREELKEAVEKTNFHQPTSHIYQNVVAKAVFDKEEIKRNLIEQLTEPVKWTQSVQAMIKDGATKFVEVGPGKVLQGLIAKIDSTVICEGVN